MTPYTITPILYYAYNTMKFIRFIRIRNDAVSINVIALMIDLTSF